MRHAGVGLSIACALALGAYLLLAGWPIREDGPVFTRISIERNTPESGPPLPGWVLPDGGLRLDDIPAAALLGLAYPSDEYDIEGLPAWSTAERYDVHTTSGLPDPTPEERQAMVRTMLAYRFGLQVRVEPREVEAYDMVVAREDGRLGPRLEKSTVDCAAVQAQWQAIGALGAPGGRHACTAWHDPGQLEATLTMTELARWLRLPEFIGRPVVDRTGLPGYFAITVRPSRRRPLVDTIRDDLGLQLVPTRIVRDTVVVERFDPPSGV